MTFKKDLMNEILRLDNELKKTKTALKKEKNRRETAEMFGYRRMAKIEKLEKENADLNRRNKKLEKALLDLEEILTANGIYKPETTTTMEVR